MILYRFLDRRYVELFRQQGILRICPLKTYRSLTDARQDRTEGLAITSISAVGELNQEQAKEIFGLDNTITFGAGGTLVHNLHLPKGYLISTSTNCAPELLARFHCDDYFTITDTTLFKAVCKRAIAESCKVVLAVDGRVSYVYEKETHVNSVPKLIQIGASLRQAKAEHYFLKPKDDYEVEAEYRFVFVVEGDKTEDPILLKFTQEEIASCCSFEK